MFMSDKNFLEFVETCWSRDYCEYTNLSNILFVKSRRSKCTMNATDEYSDEAKASSEDRGPRIIVERDSFVRKTKSSSFVYVAPKSFTKSRPLQNEILRVLQSSLLAMTVLILSYQGLRHGRIEYNILENGDTVRGYVPSRRSVVALTFGYSLPYALLGVTAAFMLIYSLFTKRARWSLPVLILFLADLVSDVSAALVVIWLLFANLRFLTATFYASLVTFLIVGEVWMWFGVFRLYEHRTFE